MARYLPMILAAWLSLGLLQGCAAQGTPTPAQPGLPTPAPTGYAIPTFVPTWTPHPPTPTNTRVIPIPPTFTPGPSPTPTRLPARTRALVIGIQDSHTIEVLIEDQSNQQVFTVRLVGIEPPLLSDPWSGVSLEWLAQETGRRVVVLESDRSERDPQGNLLRYVWKEGRMVNVAMVQLGLATVSEDAPNLNYGADLLEAQAQAQNAGRGLWGPPPTPTPIPVTVTATLTATQALTITPVVTQTLTITPTQTALR